MKISIKFLLLAAGLVFIEAALHAGKGLLFYSTQKSEDNAAAKTSLKKARRLSCIGILLLIITFGMSVSAGMSV